jgi:hypothetical protein
MEALSWKIVAEVLGIAGEASIPLVVEERYSGIAPLGIKRLRTRDGHAATLIKRGEFEIPELGNLRVKVDERLLDRP